MKRLIVMFVGVCAMCVASYAWALTDTITAEAHFTDGNGETSVDQYHGIGGNNWTGEWADVAGSALQVWNASVVSTSPLHTDSGNYLNVNVNSDGAGSGAARRFAIARAAYWVFDLEMDYTVEWSFRINEDIWAEGSNFLSTSSTADRYNIFDKSASGLYPDAGSSWIVSVWGGAMNGVAAGQWTAYDGTTAVYVDTGVTAATGTVYDFTVSVHPGTSTYDVAIYDGTDTVTKTGLGLRSALSTMSAALWHGGGCSGQNEFRDYSIDDIVISQIPEPGIFTLLATLTPLGLLLRILSRRRNYY